MRSSCPAATSLGLLISIAVIALSSPGNAYPQRHNQHARYRRDATIEAEPSREQAETDEATAEEAEAAEVEAYGTRSGRGISGNDFNARQEKSLEFYDFLRPPYYEIENEVLSRNEPSRNNYPDSPIYYIRLPPTPYMFVPGLGYVSPPPQSPPMNPFINLPLDFVANGKPGNIYQWSAPNNFQPKPVNKPNINFVSNGKPTSVYRPKPEPFGNAPYRPTYRPKPEFNIDFVSNGKPTGIYRPNFDAQTQATLDFISNGKPSTLFRPSYEDSIAPDDSPIYRPIYEPPRPVKPNSNKVNLNKGPYVFNGRPTDMYLLRNSYNALYEDALQNFYP